MYAIKSHIAPTLSAVSCKSNFRELLPLHYYRWNSRISRCQNLINKSCLLKHWFAWKTGCNYQAEKILKEFCYCDVSKHTADSTLWNITIFEYRYYDQECRAVILARLRESWEVTGSQRLPCECLVFIRA
jgi:hypothetical protein